MKIGLFGGSFNPPHLGHRILVETLLKKKIDDKVIVVPCLQQPFKDPFSVDFNTRYKIN